MNIVTVGLLPLGFGLVGAFTPCALGVNGVFLGYITGKPRAQRLTEWLIFALLATVGLLVQAWRAGQLKWARLPWLWAGHHALWEMMAEGYVMWRKGPRYRELYAGRPHRGLLLFWVGTTILTFATRPAGFHRV